MNTGAIFGCAGGGAIIDGRNMFVLGLGLFKLFPSGDVGLTGAGVGCVMPAGAKECVGEVGAAAGLRYARNNNNNKYNQFRIEMRK